MAESYLFATNKTLDQDAIVWTNQISPASTLNFSGASLTESFNETYVTAIEGNDSEYLSVLETTNEATLEDLNLTLSNSKVQENNIELNNEQSVEVTDLNISENGDQVVVFTVDGSDELYGIQMIMDEQGNSQKYQFKFRQNENGQLEAIPETIHLLLSEGEVSSEPQQELFDNQEMVMNNTQQFQNDQEVEDNDIINTETVVENHQDFGGFIKGEPCEQVITQEEGEENLEPDDEVQNEDLDVKPVALELQQAVTNMKSELFQEEPSDRQQIYQQEEHETHVIYQEESAQEIFHQDVSQEMYTQEEINQEIFNSGETEGEIYHEKEPNHAETASVQIEETLVQEDANFFEENNEQVQTFETIHYRDNQMVLETQYIPDIEEAEDPDTDDEFQDYERIYVQSDDQNPETTEETVIDAEETHTEVHEEYTHMEGNDNDEFQVVEAVHVTGEETNLETSYQESSIVKSVPSTILKQPIQNTGSNVLKQQSILNTARVPKKSKKVLCYVIQHPEKENVNAIATMVPKNYKSNPRSVLKQTAIDVSLAVGTTAQEAQVKYNQSLEKAKFERRFAKNKDAIQAKLFNNFLSKTTIPHAPVRQKRLPRKQEIKPVDTRTEEEIIVQEVMVSSNGFIESIEDRLRGKDKLEVVGYIDLSDSEDENSKTGQKKSAKNDSIIEILSSEEESERTVSVNKLHETPKKRRGRPRKTLENAQSPQKEEDNNTKTNGEANDSADESSPSKKTRTENPSTVVENDSSKKEFNCPLCSKTFPSPNSLSTHIHHHSLENSMRNSRPSTFEFKHKCLDCEATFKNSLLLNRHVCPKKNKKTTTSPQCDVCKKTFDSQLSLNSHKKIHDASSSTATFARPTAATKAKVVSKSSNAAKRLTLPKKAVDGPNKELNDNKTTEGAKRKIPSRASVLPTPQNTSRASMLPKRQTLRPGEILDGTSKYKCEKCQQSFKNAILLKKHACNAEKTNDHKCKLCNLSFKDAVGLNIHKRKHIKENLVQSTSEVQISPMKFLPTGKRDLKNSPRKSLGHLKIGNKSSPSFKVLKKFSCTSCNAKFTSKVLLDIHTRKQCVKAPINKRTSRRLSLNKTLATPNLTIMPTTPLDMHAQCDACPKNFKSYKTLLKHQITEHGYSPPGKEELMKPKAKGLVTIRAHTGIPANPRLQKSFANLLKKLQSVTPRKSDNQPEDI